MVSNIPSITLTTVDPKSLIFVCSDGVTDRTPAKQIVKAANENANVTSLVNRATANGSDDNATAVVLTGEGMVALFDGHGYKAEGLVTALVADFPKIVTSVAATPLDPKLVEELKQSTDKVLPTTPTNNPYENSLLKPTNNDSSPPVSTACADKTMSNTVFKPPFATQPTSVATTNTDANTDPNSDSVSGNKEDEERSSGFKCVI